MPEVKGYCDVEKQLASGQCFCLWKPGVECPNDYTHVVETIGKPGFMKCCEPHFEGFMRDFKADVTVYTRKEWEDSGREAELLPLIKADMEARNA